MKTQGTDQLNVSTLVDKENSTIKMIKERKKMTQRKKVIHNRITHFDRSSVVHFVDDIQDAINQICIKYGTKNVEVKNVKFAENDLAINGLHIKLHEPLPQKKEMSIIDLTIKKVKKGVKVTSETVKEVVRHVGEYVGREFKQGYRTFKILSQEGDKYEAVTRRNKKFLLGAKELDSMKLVS